jgi:hypothetical protein
MYAILPENAPGEFDLLYRERLGKLEAGPIRFLQKGLERDDVELYYWPGRGKPQKLERMKETYARRVSFGPVRIFGILVSAHVEILPPRHAKIFPVTMRSLKILQMECLAGEVELAGRHFFLGLLDRDFSESHTDWCRECKGDGDLLLLDWNGDGRFEIDRLSDETMGLTRFVYIAERLYRVDLRGKVLTLALHAAILRAAPGGMEPVRDPPHAEETLRGGRGIQGRSALSLGAEGRPAAAGERQEEHPVQSSHLWAERG